MSHMGSSDLMHHRIVRRAEVLEVTGLSRATLYRLISDGRFPAPVKLAANAVGWREAEVREWLESREPAFDTSYPASSQDGTSRPGREGRA